MRAVSLLQNALTEYLVDKYAEHDWILLGTRTNTLQIIREHPRLLRALGFGDSDYADAVASVVPTIMQNFRVDSDQDPRFSNPDYDLDYLADTFPHLMTHFRSANPRMYQRFISEVPDLPKPWQDGPQAAPPAPTPASAAPNTSAVALVFGAPSVNPVSPAPSISEDAGPSIFLAHGRDVGKREMVRNYVHQITGVMPTVLDAEANGGQTIIEKFERHAQASSIAIVLLTPDDTGALAGDPPRPRARQNVIFELGYFVGSLGRPKVIAINDGVETPSDIAGVLYIPFQSDWKERLRGELRATGVPILS